jgi:hypothetical protein
MVVPILKKALAAKRESKQIEFKEVVDVASKRDWCEITKDVIAIANSGGGVIVFGLNSHGQPTGADLTALGSLDPATIADRIQNYTRTRLIDFDVWEVEKNGQQLIAWIIDSSDVPTVFCQPGTYPIQGGKQKTAFGQGTVYFRHGAKSEPGTTEDIAKSFSGKLEQVRKEWMRNVRKVVTAPTGSRVTVLPQGTSAVAIGRVGDVTESGADSAVSIRITNDPAAPAYQVFDTDRTFPFRQKELISEVRRRLPKTTSFNSFDVFVIRQIYKIDKKQGFAHQPKYGSRQYSQKFADWLVAQAQQNEDFFQIARAKYNR